MTLPLVKFHAPMSRRLLPDSSLSIAWFLCSRISYSNKSNYAVCAVLFLASFCWEACFCYSFMLSCELTLYSLLLLSITPLYYEYYKKCLTIVFYWEPWGHFWIYTIWSEADVDISEHTLPELRFSFLLSRCTGEELLGNMVNVCLTSYRNC